MITELDKAWLAGLIDGEGCIAFMRRTDYNKHRLEVRYDVKIAMSCRETVEYCHELIMEIVGEDAVKCYEERRKVRRRRPLWRCEVSSKQAVYDLLTALLPYMRTKKLEAQLCVNYLDRARHFKRYRATDFDRQLAEAATGLRNGYREARAEAKELLGQVILSEATEGKGSVERAEISDLSPNNKNRHERPAPHPRNAEGGDMIRSSEETPSEGINSLRPTHN